MLFNGREKAFLMPLGPGVGAKSKGSLRNSLSLAYYRGV